MRRFLIVYLVVALIASVLIVAQGIEWGIKLAMSEGMLNPQTVRHTTYSLRDSRGVIVGNLVDSGWMGKVAHIGKSQALSGSQYEVVDVPFWVDQKIPSDFDITSTSITGWPVGWIRDIRHTKHVAPGTKRVLPLATRDYLWSMFAVNSAVVFLVLGMPMTILMSVLMYLRTHRRIKNALCVHCGHPHHHRTINCVECGRPVRDLRQCC